MRDVIPSGELWEGVSYEEHVIHPETHRQEGYNLWNRERRYWIIRGLGHFPHKKKDEQ